MGGDRGQIGARRAARRDRVSPLTRRNNKRGGPKSPRVAQPA
jgi:hypothetical protein